MKINCSGLAFPEYKILDAHAHTGYAFDASQVSLEEQLRVMDTLGIEKMIASNLHALYYDPFEGNEELFRQIEQYPDRLSGYAAVNPHYMEGWEAYLDRMRKRAGFAGIKLHPDFNSYPPDGPRYQEIYRYADRHNLLVLNHSFGNAKMIVEIALAYPNMKMICGHRVAYADREEVEYLRRNLEGRRDIWFDTTSSCLSCGAIELYCERLGSEHVIFGTDTPYFDPAFQVGRFLRCKLPERDRRQVLRENTLSLFGY